MNPKKMKTIIECLDYLKLSGIKETLEENIHHAEQEGMSYADFLLQNLEYECDFRRNKRISIRNI